MVNGVWRVSEKDIYIYIYRKREREGERERESGKGEERRGEWVID